MSISNLLLLAFLATIPGTTMAVPCLPSFAFQGQNLTLAKCVELPTQNATVAWNYNENSNSNNRTLEVLFVGEAVKRGGWVGWGLNPGKEPTMAGTQAFIAFQATNGSTILTYNITSETQRGTAPLACTPITLELLNSAVEITSNINNSSTSSISMLVFVRLPALPLFPATALNLVWNRGASVSNFQPSPHSFEPADLRGLAILDATSGAISFPTPAPGPATP